MLDDKEILTRYDRYGILDAVKYVKTESGFGLKESKEYVDRLVNTRANYDPTKGTITWFKCKDKLPPKSDDRPFTYTDNMLITNGEDVDTAPYCHNPAQGEPYWHHYNDWAPTHWAFINLPK